MSIPKLSPNESKWLKSSNFEHQCTTNETVFTAHYLELYERGETGLGRLSSCLQSKLEKLLQSKLKTPLQLEKLEREKKLCKTYISLKETALIYKVATKAEDDYDLTPLGERKRNIQNLLKRICPFNYKTSREKATEALENLDQRLEELKTKIKEKDFDILNCEAAYQAYTFMARHNSTLRNIHIKYTVLNEEHEVFPNSEFYARPKSKNNAKSKNNRLYIQRPGQALVGSSVYEFDDKKGLIAFGGEGGVHKATQTCWGGKKKVVAIKISDSDPQTIENNKQSACILEKFHSDEIIKGKESFTMHIGAYNHKKDLFELKKDEPAAYFVTELYAGDLHNLLNKKHLLYKKYLKPLRHEERKCLKKRLIALLVNAFHEVHQKNVIHGDVKIENVLVKINDDKSITPVLADFTMSVSSEDKVREKEFCGTPWAAAPEHAEAWYKRRCDKDKNITAEKTTQTCVDIWGLGLMCYHIYTGKKCGIVPSFRRETADQLKFVMELKQSAVDRLFTDEKVFSKKDKEFAELIKSMLQVDPRKRATAAKLKASSALKRIDPDGEEKKVIKKIPGNEPRTPKNNSSSISHNLPKKSIVSVESSENEPTDLYSGSLYKLLDEKGLCENFLNLSNSEKTKCFKEQLIAFLINNLYKIHEKGTIHRDPRVESTLVEIDDKGNIKDVRFTDLSMNVHSTDKEGKSRFCGIPGLVSPEYAAAWYEREYGKKANITAEKTTNPCLDIWGLGLMCYHVYTGKECEIVPSSNEAIKDQLKSIMTLEQSKIDDLPLFKDNRRPLAPKGEQFDNQLIGLIYLMLQVNPDQRPTAEQLGKALPLKKQI